MQRFIGALVVAAVLAIPGAVAAQEAGAAPPQQQGGTDLVFEREVFTYPAFERGNPFHPLAIGEGGIVRYEQLTLMGILYSDNPSESVAVLSTGELTVAEDGSGASRGVGQAFYAKVGQTVGNVRIIEIHQSEIVVEVDEFGIWERKIMQLQTRRLGGTQ